MTVPRTGRLIGEIDIVARANAVFCDNCPLTREFNPAYCSPVPEILGNVRVLSRRGAKRAADGGKTVAFFGGTHRQRIDKKGRVVLPSTFRNAFGDDARRFIAFGSIEHDGIECRPSRYMEELSTRLSEPGIEPELSNRLIEAYFGSAREVTYDSEGRMILPQDLIVRLGIEDELDFVGKGDFFELWQPSAHDDYAEKARSMASADRLALRQRLQADRSADAADDAPAETGK